MKKILIVFISLLLGLEILNAYQNNKTKTNCDSFCYALKQIKEPQTREDGLNNLMELALQGDARAKSKIGEIFIFGEYGFKRDCKKGVVFLLESLTKEGKNIYHGYDISALKTIAKMFEYGICVKKNLKKYKKYINEYYKESYKEKYHLQNFNLK